MNVMLVRTPNWVEPDLGCHWHPKGNFACALMQPTDLASYPIGA